MKRIYLFLVLISAVEFSNAQQRYRLNAAALQTKPFFSLPFKTANPQGETFSVNNWYFEHNGKPWFPLMGEFHYWRYPDTYWEEQIIKMKSAGLQIVATYVYWGAHEKPKGVWNWEGSLNLKKFVELCKRHNMYVWLRPGPYINADVLGRGFPDWINTMKGKRRNTLAYLAETEKYFAQVGTQTKGLYFSEGGPIIGVQLENEYASGDKTHIANLKSIAQKSGITPVYWSVTANSVFQHELQEVLPLQGAYCYRGWEGGKPLTNDFLFGDDQWIMGMDLGGLYYPLDSFPRGTCEQGGGMQETFIGRFIVQPSVIEAHAVTQYGRGINMLGYFMFQGGTQYPGTELPLDDGSNMPSGLMSYNYQAPLGEFGEVNESYHYLKMHHLFLQDFGDRIVCTLPVPSPNPVKDPKDLTALRYAGRFNAKGEGFVFIGNTQNYRQMTEKKLSFDIALPSGNLLFPKQQVTIKDNRVSIWPVNFVFNEVKLNYATAQVLCKIDTKEADYLFMYETEGIYPEISLDASAVEKISAPGWNTDRSEKNKYILTANSVNNPITIINRNGRKIVITVLSRSEAEHAWKYKYNGQEYLFISNADLMFSDHQIEARQFTNPLFSIKVFPQVNFLKGKWGKAVLDKNKFFYQYTIIQKKTNVPVKTVQVNDSVWTIQANGKLPSLLSDVFVSINFKGNLITANLQGKQVADQVNIGKNWMVGLKRFLPLIQKEKLKLYATSENRYGPPVLPAAIQSVTILPEYRIATEF